MRVEDRLRAAGVKVEGTFDVQRFYDALGRILSQKYGVEITFKVHEIDESDEDLDKETV